MAIFRSFTEIVNSIIERLRLTQPNLDTKPGTVARDLFVDIQADQLQRLHSALLLVAEKQTPESASGVDLDRWASNFGISRKPGAPANGIVVFTIGDITSDISIPEGTIVTSRSNQQFRTVGNFVMSSAEKNRFAANASRLRNSLNLAGIRDAYAIEVPVRATSVGTTGNISNYQIIESDIREAISVTNISSFNGGSNLESDSTFRARVFAVFSGSNTGTAFGYRNTALGIPGVNDAVIIQPGNTLMLRDGTETIQVNDGSFRILESGTGGKVDLYILGKQLLEVVESYVYTDRSGTGNAADERNDYILGQGAIDPTLTSEERRLQAFNEGKIPQQPVDSLISIVGSSSGVLSEKITDYQGVVSGNYELIKDLNPETGGSPFGFDKIRFISSEKSVKLEGIVKKNINSVDPLRFPGSKSISQVYQDISIVGENSRVSSADRSIIKLNHAPAVSVTRVTNKTTGEIYVIENQNVSSLTGLNKSGEVYISGKTLPSQSDILSVNYVWRVYFDKYLDYNGADTGAQFVDPNVSGSVDWGTSNGFTAEESIIEETEDGLEYKINLAHNISRVISVYTKSVSTGVIENILSSTGELVPGFIIPETEPPVSNIISVRNANGVELYNTKSKNGSFYARTIILPTDSSASISETATVTYNRVEYYDIYSGDGAFSNNVITLPSKSVLESNAILDDVEDLAATGEIVYIDYIAELISVVPSTSLSSLPISGSELSNSLLNSTLTTITNSNQPIYYLYDQNLEIQSVQRFGPTRLSITTQGVNRFGKIKVAGETLTRVDLELNVIDSFNGMSFNLLSPLKSALNLTSIPSSMGIARVDYVASIDNPEKVPDLFGHKIKNNIYGQNVADIDATLSNVEFRLPETSYNLSLKYTSGERIAVSLLLYNTADTEEIFFPGNARMITDKRFARISKISVTSGFRSPAGSLIGSVRIDSFSQPVTSSSYYSDYKFTAPIEGERLTIRYNLNRLIADVTSSLEKVRCITADVLVKESPTLSVDVSGEIIVNSDFTSEVNTVIENASNAVVNLLGSVRLGTTVDYSDIINVVTNVPGVDSVNISLFNESGSTGRRTYIKALDNQAISAGSVTFNSIARKDFRIT